jgi:hypothetical protein
MLHTNREGSKRNKKRLILHEFFEVNLFFSNFTSIKKVLFFAAFVISTTYFLSACSKNSVDTNAAEISRIKTLLTAKWMFVNYTTNHHYANNDNLNITSASLGDYMSFTGDNKLILRLLNFDDVSTYSVLPNNRIILYGVYAFDIKTLSATQLVLYQKNVVSTEDYYEETYTFQK